MSSGDCGMRCSHGSTTTAATPCDVSCGPVRVESHLPGPTHVRCNTDARQNDVMHCDSSFPRVEAEHREHELMFVNRWNYAAPVGKRPVRTVRASSSRKGGKSIQCGK